MTPAIPVDVRSQVAIYRQRGWYCVPLRPRSKSPVRNDWPNVRIETDDIKTSFSAKDNVGIILGEPSDWLVDVDLDCPEAIELADSYPIRVKANQKEALHVDQPHLTLFGTATPQYFYESLSRRMLTNGFFARLNIIDVGKRGKGQTPGSAREIPEHILEVAKWWSDYAPNGGNFMSVHPKPAIVPFTPDAETAITDLRLQTEVEYDKAGDEVARAAWSRTCEHAKKLALIYACSETHESPQITLAAVRWASEFSLHQTRRQLYLASVHVAENPFHKECLKFMKRLQDESSGVISRRQIMRTMKMKSNEFDQVVDTLIQQEQIKLVWIESKTKPAKGYQITVD